MCMKEKQTLENICVGEKDKINWKETENILLYKTINHVFKMDPLRYKTTSVRAQR